MNNQAIWETDKGVFLRVLVRPRSKEKEFIHSVDSQQIVLNLQGAAKEGKANTELVKRIAKYLGISTSQVILAAGHKSRDKTLILAEIPLEEVKRVLLSRHKQ